MELQFENITKKYGKKYALYNFSVTLGNGVYGLLGTNGAGKTTLLNVFMGITRANGGIIRLNGKDISGIGSDLFSNIGYLPQSSVFYRDFTVESFLRYLSVLKGREKKQSEERIGAVSGGMRQRLGIAQAMLNDPGILILDEPTAGLDPRERIRFRNLISRFAEGRIVIIATHIVSDVEFIANYVLLLHEGKLLRLDSPSALCEELRGKVWALSLDAQDVPAELLSHTSSNLVREDGGIRLRILSDSCPHPKAEPVTANLEEVFLYHCGEDRI